MAYPYYPTYQAYPQYQPVDHLGQLRQQIQPQQAPMQTPQQSMIWVSGEQEAMGFLVAPNSAVALWDSSAPIIYLKQADASGRPNIKTYDLVERAQRSAPAAQSPAVEYAPLSRLEALEAQVSEMLSAKEVSE